MSRTPRSPRSDALGGAGAALRRQRRTALGGFLGFGAWWGAWGAVLPAVQRSAGVDDGGLGSALLFVGGGALASMRVTGRLVDRFGDAVLPAVVLAFAVVGVTPALVRGGVALTVSLALLGAASGAVDVAVNTASARYEATSRQPLMHLAHAMFSVGVIGSSVIAGGLRAAGASPAVVLALVGGGLVLLALGMGLRAVGPRHGGRRQRPAAPDGARLPAPWPSWRPPGRLVVIGVLIALAYFVENAWQSWSAVHLERNLAAGPAISALGPALFASSAAAGRLAGQRLTRRHRAQRLVAAGGALAAAGTVTAATGATVPLVLLGVVGAGVGTSVCAPTLFSLAARNVAAAHRGAVTGSVTTLAYLGFVLAPAFVGLLARVSSLRLALACVAGAAVLLTLGSGRARAG